MALSEASMVETMTESRELGDLIVDKSALERTDSGGGEPDGVEVLGADFAGVITTEGLLSSEGINTNS